MDDAPSTTVPTRPRSRRWIGWSLVFLAFVGLMAIGVTQDSGPRTQRERIDAISKRLACPTCDGESVYESRASSSENLRNEIARQVAEGQRTDDEIVQYIEARYGGQVLLVPRADGLDALVWALPVAVLVLAVAGLAVAFRRWSRETTAEPTDADRALVDAARHVADGDPS